MLVKGVDVNAVDDKGWAPLHLAAALDSSVMCTALHNLGASLDVTSSDGLSALMLAAKFGHVDTAKALVELGANALLNHGVTNQTALDYAKENGHEHVVSLLGGGEPESGLGEGEEPQSKPGAQTEGTSVPIGTTKLFEAARKGHTAQLKRLVQEDEIDVNAADTQHGGGTALMYASRHGHLEAIQTLAALGCNVEAADKVCSYAIAFPVITNISPSSFCVQWGLTALMWAGRLRKAKAVQALLGLGAGVENVNKVRCAGVQSSMLSEANSATHLVFFPLHVQAGETARDYAQKYNHTDILELLGRGEVRDVQIYNTPHSADHLFLQGVSDAQKTKRAKTKTKAEKRKEMMKAQRAKNPVSVAIYIQVCLRILPHTPCTCSGTCVSRTHRSQQRSCLQAGADTDRPGSTDLAIAPAGLKTRLKDGNHHGQGSHHRAADRIQGQHHQGYLLSEPFRSRDCTHRAAI